MGAPSGINWNFTQALGAFLGGGVCGSGRFSHPADERVDGRYHEEVHGRCDEQEGDRGINEIADQEFASADAEAQS